MSSLAIILILISCTTHATWNLLSKTSSKTPVYFWVSNLIVILIILPFFWLWGGLELSHAPRSVGLCLLTTGLFQASYFAFLAFAYRHGDVSVVYPIARSAPVFVVPLAGLLLHQWPTRPALLGIVLVVGGCFLLPIQTFDQKRSGITWRTYVNRASLWAVATALASSGYTLIDSIGIKETQHFITGARGAFLYGYLELVISTLYLTVPALLLDGKTGIWRVWREERRSARLVGALMFGSYLLILWAYGVSSKVAYVAGFRQLSIVLGVLGGVVFFKEPGGRIRLLASLIMVCGLALIALSH